MKVVIYLGTPHTHQLYLFAVFLPPQSTTEQVSLNMGPPSPPCVRAEISHWRDLQTEESKIHRGNLFGSDKCNSHLKSCLWHQLHWKGPIDLEKYKLEQGTIWNWTDPTLLTTAPEKISRYICTIIIFKLFTIPLIFTFKTYYLAKKRTLYLKQISYIFK